MMVGSTGSLAELSARIRTKESGNMTKYRLELLLIVVVYALIGYVPLSASGATPAECPQITSREIASAQDNPYYGAILSLRWGPAPCCDSFSLRVSNNTGKPLEILWDKTFYVHNGIREGGFVFGQPVCSEADLPHTSPVSPRGSFKVAIWPEALVHSDRSAHTCSHSFLETGQDGVFITVKGDGVEMSETVTLDLNFKHLFPQNG